MKINIFDKDGISNNQIDYLKTFGDVEIHLDVENPEEFNSLNTDADIVITDMFRFRLDEKSLSQARNLKLIMLNSIGFDNVDIDYLNSCGIGLTNVPGYSTEGVAEHAIGLMFAVNRNIVGGNSLMRSEPIEFIEDQTLLPKFTGVNLRGKTFGVLGLGQIGRKTAEIATGIGMRAIGYNRSEINLPYVGSYPLEEVFRQSDFLSIHLALNDETKHIVNKAKIELMKESAVIINTARAGHINETDLYEALKNKRIRGAGLDMVSNVSKNNPLFELENVVITPHIAYLTKESVENIGKIIVENLKAFLNGDRLNRIV